MFFAFYLSLHCIVFCTSRRRRRHNVTTTTNNRATTSPPHHHDEHEVCVSGSVLYTQVSFISYCRDAVPKQCCGLGSPPVRWSILGVGIVGLVCAAAGALLGALRATGRDHIAVSLLMIGKTTYFFIFNSS